MISRLAIKIPHPYEWWSNSRPPGQEKRASNARGMPGGWMLKLRFDWYITCKWIRIFNPINGQKKSQYWQTKGRKSNCERKFNDKLFYFGLCHCILLSFQCFFQGLFIQVSAGFVQMNFYDRLIHTIHHSGAWGVSLWRTRVFSVSALSISAYFFHRDLQVVHRVHTNWLPDWKQATFLADLFLAYSLYCQETNSDLLHICRNLKFLANGPDRHREHIIQSVNRLHRLLFSELEELQF